MKFYKLRILIFVIIAKILSKILFVEFPPVVSVAAHIKRENKMLFLDLSYRKGFCLPGGIIKAGEDAETALKREIFEETGLTIVKSEYLWSVSSSTNGIKTLSLIFSVEADGQLHESEEGTLYWLDPKDVIGKMAYTNNEIAIKKYLGMQN